MNKQILEKINNSRIAPIMGGLLLLLFFLTKAMLERTSIKKNMYITCAKIESIKPTTKYGKVMSYSFDYKGHIYTGSVLTNLYHSNDTQVYGTFFPVLVDSNNTQENILLETQSDLDRWDLPRAIWYNCREKEREPLDPLLYQ